MISLDPLTKALTYEFLGMERRGIAWDAEFNYSAISSNKYTASDRRRMECNRHLSSGPGGARGRLMGIRHGIGCGRHLGLVAAPL